MENGSAAVTGAGDVASPPPPRSHSTPPPPPDPSKDAPLLTSNGKDEPANDEPLRLESENWDITSISALAAVRMLIQALEPLAEATGNIPPTPPVSRPVTPRKEPSDPLLRRLSSPDASGAPPITIGSPEAPPYEAIPILSPNAPDATVQHAAVARRFFSKVAPAFSLTEYLLRIHKYCPHSPGVYLAAAAYCHRLCVSDLMVPATSRTVHRLALAAIRVSAKALEDNKWAQDRMAKVGGVSKPQLMNLEVALCFLLDFDLGVDAGMLARRMFLLQQAGRQGMGARSKLNDSFKLKLPLRRKLAMAQAAG
ncbi:cyclin-domain-containing protein [Neohortaea acidophila]|uniref:Cyclin-domain-containing protein n=1 Tax=Neohortaea acidophila TaxID=245834 RepID=A0A6A6PYR0_9PEZI|nr:cyclin-domain-containing protein [Neohortaea acidophila]KAF2484906.1 cyclin-domain-containing protein [Neohortaea acidophila]